MPKVANKQLKQSEDHGARRCRDRLADPRHRERDRLFRVHPVSQVPLCTLKTRNNP